MRRKLYIYAATACEKLRKQGSLFKQVRVGIRKAVESYPLDLDGYLGFWAAYFFLQIFGPSRVVRPLIDPAPTKLIM